MFARCVARFSLIGPYSFLAGVLVSLSANLFTETALSGQTTMNPSVAYGVCGILFGSSAAFASMGWMLHTARLAWVQEGAKPEWEYKDSALGHKKRWIVSMFALGVLGLAYCVLALSTRSWGLPMFAPGSG